MRVQLVMRAAAARVATRGTAEPGSSVTRLMVVVGESEQGEAEPWREGRSHTLPAARRNHAKIRCNYGREATSRCERGVDERRRSSRQPIS